MNRDDPGWQAFADRDRAIFEGARAGRGFREMGAEFGITAERARQIYNHAVRRIRWRVQRGLSDEFVHLENYGRNTPSTPAGQEVAKAEKVLAQKRKSLENLQALITTLEAQLAEMKERK